MYPVAEARIRVDGKLLRRAAETWYVKGLTYGPFPPNSGGQFLPEPAQWRRDLAQISALGANSIRLYHPPPLQFLDDAGEAGLAVLIDVPWEKHRCFLEDREARVDAIGRVGSAARKLGAHPAVFGISVANEVPPDVVRFFGASKIARFIGTLVDACKQEAPDCLATYCNFPSTEFLAPPGIDFYCANVYLEDSCTLGTYLDRLHHVAGDVPVVLSEFGMDVFRRGEARQSEVLAQHVREVFRRGLAGSFVFSFTDEWFRGGYRIEDWAFGVTTADRRERPAAAELRRAWARVPHLAPNSESHVPKVSVVVCSYNGAATLGDCLSSLLRLDYQDYDIILVDDGSTDDTPAIAARFPSVKYLRQENLGLSAARNAGARAASGQIVAYTDSDCVADPTWLSYLVTAMRDQGVDAIGGPNVPPPGDGWVAHCVAASPGGPSHVMLNDRLAEHVPGCNMAFRRDKLLAIGGFDLQFRQAGDDVDVCWRFIDAGWRIGFAPAALVWHHRRGTVGAYLRQQKGYGRSEAMVQFKHPHRFNALGGSRWLGVIYGGRGAASDSDRATVYHGRFGYSPFQIVYRQNRFGWPSYLTLLEWHALAVSVGVIALVCGWLPLLILAGLMEGAAICAAAVAASRAALPDGAAPWCRPLVTMLHLLQPVVRSWHRYRYRVLNRKLPPLDSPDWGDFTKRISSRVWDAYFHSDRGVGRERLLEEVESAAKAAGWAGDYHAEWAPHDVELVGDLWHNIRLRTATEELGGAKRFTRVRASLHWSGATKAAVAAAPVFVLASAAGGRPWGALAGAGAAALLAMCVITSVRRCRRAVARLVHGAGVAAGLDVVQPVADTSEVTPGQVPGRSRGRRTQEVLDKMSAEVCGLGEDSMIATEAT